MKKNQTLVDLFVEQARHAPHAIAIHDDGDQMTYGELNKLSNNLAYILLSQGVLPGEVVPVLESSGINILIAIIGILKSGAAFAPVDMEYPPGRIKHIIEDCSPRWIIASESDLAVKMPGHYLIVNINSLKTETDEEALISINCSDHGSLAYVIYTSGSTGQPKGVMVGHAQICAYTFAVYERMALEHCNSYALLGSFSADAAYTAVFCALCFGKALHVLGVKNIRSFQVLIDYFNCHTIDCYKITPSLLHFFIQNNGHRAILPRLRLIVGGEACPMALARQVRGLLPQSCKFYNHYGPTETTVGVIVYEFPPTVSQYPEVVPLGRPLSCVSCWILDQDLNVCESDQEGELYIEGALVALGYWNKKALTHEKFVNLTLKGKSRRLYRTGDIVRRWADDTIEYLGRTDDQVKINGRRIELKEIEHEINRDPFVCQSIVMLKEVKKGVKHLVGYVQPQKGFDKERLLSQLKGLFPNYMVPTQWVEIEDWPLTFNNKIDKKSLPLPAASNEKIPLPVTEQDKELFEIWCHALPAPSDDMERSFFALGGDSIALMKLKYRVHEALNVELSPADLFEGLTFTKLKGTITERLNKGEETCQKKDQFKLDERRVTNAQKNLFIQSKLNPSVPFPHAFLTYEIIGDLDLMILTRSLNKIIHHHESLRSSYYLEKKEVCRKLHTDVLIQVQTIEAETDDPDHELSKISKAFRLDEPPLLRVTILSLSNGRSYLHFEMPHINSDGESMKVIMEQLELHFNNGSLPFADYQFADFKKARQYYFNSPQYMLDKKYWEKVLAESLVAPLRKNDSVSSHSRFEGAHFVMELSDAIRLKVSEVADGKGITLFQYCLMAFSLLIHRLTGAEDIIILLPVHNRLDRHTEKIVGLISNVLPVRFTIDTATSLDAWKAQCISSITQALKHQQFPFENNLEIWMHHNRSIKELQGFFFGYHRQREAYRLCSTLLRLVHPLRSHEDLPLSMAITETDSNLVLRLSSNKCYYTYEELREWSTVYTAILHQLQDNDHQKNLETLVVPELRTAFT
ncbi:amino acid adenylation domain-containing protein [Fulvivirga sp. M361]|uniref:non-ribosomal peptide synthetase n=1 Tax=Fulvivirga sp. M361 TaxID=2594266 RepID=UPI00117A1DD5|nr:non-ribosomal peptide synthetase [Fulvivirga sp. M361]TRX60214.1 amino acid adenylation domain-containing protein [Fulvivirga sp. M361]